MKPFNKKHIAFIAIFIIVFSLLAISCNSVLYRMLRYGDSDINDFKKFPSRKLIASNKPSDFVKDTLTGTDVFRNLLKSGVLSNAIEENNTLAFLVIHNDTLVYEKYYDGYDSNSLVQYFSMTKSVMSLLIGCAIDDGLIKSEYDYVTQYIPEFQNKGFNKITLFDLLQMQAPVNYSENDNPLGKHVRFYYTSHLEDEILNLTADENGEKEFVYRSCNSAILSLILKRVLKSETITQYLQRKIWTPLGMESPAFWTIDNDTNCLEKVWCCLAGTARDYARFANLFIHNGKCGVQQIISESWINKTYSPLFEKDKEMEYNYNWWIYKRQKAIMAIGKDGQFAYVVPSKKIVIIRLGDGLGSLKRLDWVILFDKIANTF